MNADGTGLTLGIEEEFHLVDLESRRPVPGVPKLLTGLPEESFAPELQRSIVETNSAVCDTLDDVRSDLLRLRGTLVGAAAGHGWGIAAAGTMPLLPDGEGEITSNPRFDRMQDEYQILAREQLICGAQVHVGMLDREMAVKVCQRVTPWLPTLLALSASSPFWAGQDTGYASARSLVWQRWPTAGYSGPVGSLAEYDALVNDLVASGVVSDPGMIYFDVRPSAHVPTIELRVCDSCPSVDDVVLLAGLFRALVRRERDAILAGDPAPTAARVPLQRAAMWRAARSGLESELVDPLSERPLPAGELVARLVGSLRGQLEAEGDWAQVAELAEAVVRGGGAANRLRRAFRVRGQLTEVVDLAVADTGRGTGPAAAVPGASAGRGRSAAAPPAGGSLLTDYPAAPGDEAVEPDGVATPEYEKLLRTFDDLGLPTIHERERARDRAQQDAGVVFRVEDESEPRPFAVDLVPRIVPAAEWAALQAGLAQRSLALDAFLRDVHGQRNVVRDGIVPEWVIEESPGLRHSGRLVPDGVVRAHVVGADLVRDGRGTWMVLEDNLRVPSGVGYAVQNRRLSDLVLPDLPRPAGLLSVEGSPALLRRTLVAAAPPASGPTPSIVLLNDGPANSAVFEHQLLAEEMGIPVVETRDLLVADGVVRMRTGGSSTRRVDVIYVRLEEDDLATLPAADGEPIGPALFAAMRAGTVTLANAPGNGVGDDKALYAFVPKLVEYYLGGEALLPDVPTYLCGDPEQLETVLGRMDELVWKPVDGYGGAGVLIGPHASEAELAATRREVELAPHRWIAQELVSLSTHPTFDGGRLEPRHVDLRAFVYIGEGVQVAPAALTRVAPADSMVVNSSRGGGAKDTWLLGR